MWRADDSTEDLVLLYVKKTDEEPNTISFYGYSATLKANSPDWYPTQGIIDLYTDEDLRKEVYFEKSRVKVEDYVMNDIYVVSKYKGNPIYNTTADPRYIIRPKVFRMGEIYMIAAEAAYMSNSTGDKAPDKYLNAFRASRGLAPVASTDAALLKDIKEERTRELAFEGHRLWDLRRWGDQMKRMSPQKSADLSPNGIEIGSDFLTTMVPFDFLVNPDNHRWIWPIPYNELTTTVNIKNQQNPGW